MFFRPASHLGRKFARQWNLNVRWLVCFRAVRLPHAHEARHERRTRTLFGFGTIAALTILAGPVAAQQGTLVGNVKDEVTGNPVPLVEILILGGGESRTAVTNNQGRYSVQLPAGTYDLVVSEIL